MSPNADGKWRFALDRGGTFTDIVAISPAGTVLMEKTPSDSVSGGMRTLRDMLGLAAGEKIPAARVADIRVGSTISTNTLLERKGTRTAVLLTRGFADLLVIGNQTRPRLFDLDARRPPPLYAAVREIDERLAADGSVVTPLDVAAAERVLEDLYVRGFRCLAIALMHACRNPVHERRLARLAVARGYREVFTSEAVSSLMKYVPRAQTAVAEVYLAGGLNAYVGAIREQCEEGVRLLFMQSNGALTEADHLRAVHTIMSGPAGGVIGVAEAAERAGLAQVIGFDMGGTSTDVCLGGVDTLRQETVIDGIPLFVPMLDVHTVASGGGSIVRCEDGRLLVGPHSAGATPGPACYRQGGPLTITDCHVLLGKLRAKHFPAVFGPEQSLPPDEAVVRERFAQMERETGIAAVDLAQGFVAVAVEHIVAAIRRIAVSYGVNPADGVVNSFGGAAGQHACSVAAALGVGRVLVQRQASGLSAWGIALADEGLLRGRSLECALAAPAVADSFDELATAVRARLGRDGLAWRYVLRCRYEGSEATLPILWEDDIDAMERAFARQHRRVYGYDAPGKAVIAAVAEVRATVVVDKPAIRASLPDGTVAAAKRDEGLVHFAGGACETPFYDWDTLPADAIIEGPAIVFNRWNTVVVEPGWRAEVLVNGDLLLQPQEGGRAAVAMTEAAMIEVMNSRYTFVAEQMGEVLRQTAVSVNIRERLDFSCALFDGEGRLIANAPHIPVHLGSMSESVRDLIRENPRGLARGDIYLTNSPYHGGTHLPDMTVIRAGRLGEGGGAPEFFVAARGHHADVGGVSPGSMPAHSRHIDEEGVLLGWTPVVIDGRFDEAAVRAALREATYPARSPDENVADLRAQVAALATGVNEMRRAGDDFGNATVLRYLQVVQENAERAASRLIKGLPRRLLSESAAAGADEEMTVGTATVRLDDGQPIVLAVRVHPRAETLTFDFAGSARQHPANFNAPTAIVRAAVIYCLRVLLGEDIPLNDGLLKPVHLRLPEDSLLSPRFPAAVAAGNVEVSQHLVDVIFSALGVCAGGQGTCNNLSLGVGDRQYYETIGGGMGASVGVAGGDAVQVHMTNSRATDPEILEWRYPVRLERFGVRRGSGGDGGRRGGDGVVRHLRFLQAGEVNVLSSHRRQPPAGLAGGGDGQCGVNQIWRADGRCENLGGCGRAIMDAGDCVVIETPGGGGYGFQE